MIAASQQAADPLSALPLSVACEVLEVNRGSYYRVDRLAAPTAPTRWEVALRDTIERLVLEFPGDGYRRVTAALNRAGWAVNHKRVLRLMRQ